jgi:hypothetical protein
VTRRAAALVAALALAAGAAPARASLVGLQDDRIQTVDGPELEARLDGLAATGVRMTRVDVSWADVAPARPRDPTNPDDAAYRWSRYDAIFRGLAARGIGVIADFYVTPPWATRSGAPNAAPRAADGAAFAGALGRRYSGAWPDPLNAGRHLPELRRIEVWNEPNLGQFYFPQCRKVGSRYALDSPRTYAALLAASYRTIRAANPDAIVVGGVAGPVGDTSRVCASADSSVGTLTFIQQLARQRPPIDAWSQHVYPIGSPSRATFFPSWSTMRALARAVDRLRKGIPIYVTETGYHTSYNRYHRYFVSERQQAAWLRETFQQAARFPRVPLTVWFNLQDNPYWTGGLLRADASAKPAYAAFAQLAGSSPPLPPGWAP